MWSGYSPVSHILSQMIVREEIMASPLFCFNSARMLTAPGDFPPFRYFTAACTSSLGMGELSLVSSLLS